MDFTALLAELRERYPWCPDERELDRLHQLLPEVSRGHLATVVCVAIGEWERKERERARRKPVRGASLEVVRKRKA